MRKHGRYLTLAIALLVVLTAMCITASAGEYGAGCPFCNWYNGTVHGGIYIDVKGHYDNAGATQTEIFENVPDGRRIVRFYPGIWLGSPSPGRVTYWNITINGHADGYNFTEPESLPFCDWDIPPEDGTGEHCTVSCTGYGQCSVTYNASLYIVTGNNTITFWTSEQIDQFALLVVYENESMPEMQYWIKEGHVYLGPDDAPYYVDFAETPNTGPIEPDLISSAEHFTYGCPRPPGKYADEGGCWPCLNGNYIDAPNITYNNEYAKVSYHWTNIPPSYISSPSNRFLYSTLHVTSSRLWVTFLALKYDTTPPSVTNATASPAIIPEDTDNEPQWGENSTLNVTVTDASNIASVTINLSAIGGSANQPMTNIEGSDVWSVTANASNGTAGWNVTTNAYVPYSLQVNATDEHGYSNTNVSLILTVMKNGDANEDGNATDSDAMYIFRWWLHKPGFEQINRAAADVSGDGVVTAYDALYLFKWYLNKPGFEVLK